MDIGVTNCIKGQWLTYKLSFLSGKSTSQVVLRPEELLDPMECYKFLITGANSVGLENYIQMELSNFSHLSRFRQGVSLRHMLDIVTGVITRLVRICLKYSSIHRKYCQDRSYIDILRLAVENVVYFEVELFCAVY